MTAARVTPRYSNRLRRVIDQLKKDAESLTARMVVVESGGGGSYDVDSIGVDIDGTTTETISDPTAYGQKMIRTINKIVNIGNFEITFDTATSGISVDTVFNASTAGSIMMCESGKLNDNWVWYVTLISGFVATP